MRVRCGMRGERPAYAGGEKTARSAPIMLSQQARRVRRQARCAVSAEQAMVMRQLFAAASVCCYAPALYEQGSQRARNSEDTAIQYIERLRKMAAGNTARMSLRAMRQAQKRQQASQAYRQYSCCMYSRRERCDMVIIGSCHKQAHTL